MTTESCIPPSCPDPLCTSRKAVSPAPCSPLSSPLLRRRRILEDGEGFYLYTVVVLRKFLHKFKLACKEKRCGHTCTHFQCLSIPRPLLTGRCSVAAAH